MKVDKIVKNANVFTSNKDMLRASAFAVKDGKFVYVGDEEGLKDFEGEVVDLGGKFVMPALMDSHIHIPICVSEYYALKPLFIDANSKEECLKVIADTINENPDLQKYKFMMSHSSLNGEKLTRYDLDEISTEKEIIIMEGECHSAWVNSLVFENGGITDETPDMAPGLSYYEKDENGHNTGYLIEMVATSIFVSDKEHITDDNIKDAIKELMDYYVSKGVVAAFEAGTPANPEFHERVYKVMREMDRDGELPVYIDGSYMVCDRNARDSIIDVMKHYREEFNEGNLRVNTFKILSDGTLSVHTASLVTPYEDQGGVGGQLFDKYEIKEIIKELNENGFDLHVHTVGEKASKTILDGVEMAKQELGDDYNVNVTCAHLEIFEDEDINRFKELGVNANFSAWWNAGGGSGGGGTPEEMAELLGEDRSNKMYRSKTIMDTGANVCFSSDNVSFCKGDFRTWNPYLGMEAGITRLYDEKTNVPEEEKMYIEYPAKSECMTHEDMLLGYTINNAKQLRIEDRKGSIEEGKDADYLIFDEDMTTVNPRGMSYISPKEVFFKGKKMV